MENYISILLLIVPGFISKRIYDLLNHSTKSEAGMGDIVIPLFYSVFIVLINYIYLVGFGTLNTYSMGTISELFKAPEFIIYYILLTTLNLIFIALVFDKTNLLFLKVINCLRKWNGKNKLNNTTSILANLCDGRHHLLSIIDEKGNIETGLYNMGNYIDGKLASIALKGQKDFEKTDLNLFKEKRRYYNAFDNNNIVIEYDIENYKMNKKLKKRHILYLFILVGIIGIVIGISFLFSFFY